MIALLVPLFLSAWHPDGVGESAWAVAVRCRDRVAAERPLAHPSLLTVVDYSQPSTARRLWVVDVDRHEVLFHELVAHGKGSGENVATTFSDRGGSDTSSLGVFVTAETYDGRHGYSLKLDGLEPGFNDRARARDIVIHGADYVSDDFARQFGRLGRSWGCPALNPSVAKPVIDAIAGGSVVVVYANDADWLARSTFAKP